MEQARTGYGPDVAPRAGFETRLRAAGLRVTAPRLAILSVLAEGPGHLTVDEVAQRARRLTGTVSTQAVYDVLSALSRVGLARPFEAAGSPVRYEARVGDNHHHLVCRGCGRIDDTDCVVGAAPCLEPSDAHGFSVDEAEVTFWGTCPDCQTNAQRSERREST
jgi:Fur family transcriptional regulator, stress-responsive regulator